MNHPWKNRLKFPPKSGKTTLIGILLILTAVPLWAFRFQPISADLAPRGPEAVHTFVAENTGSDPIALRVRMFTRESRLDGREVNRDAADKFVVFPQQMVLRPGQVQAIRIQWRGPEQIDREQAFRIVAEQLPVEFESRQTQGGAINIMFRYRGAVYILPENPRHQVAIRSITPIIQDSKPAAELIFENSGNAHTILNDLSLTISAQDNPDSTISFTPEELPGIAGENLLAGALRRVVLPLPDHLAGRGLSAEFSFTAVR